MKIVNFVRDTCFLLDTLRKGRVSELRSMADAGKLLGFFQVTKFANEQAFLAGTPYHVGVPFANALVTVGLAEMWKLITDQGGTDFGNTNGYLGVGTSTTAVNVSQTDLLGTNARVAQDVGYPLAPTTGLETWRSTFGSGVANFSWQEFAVFNDASAGVMLNRSLSNQGTKTAGQTWQLTYTITLS